MRCTIRPPRLNIHGGIVDFEVGADGGGRTHTLSRVLDFESSASANSATSATKRNGTVAVARATYHKVFIARKR